MSLFRSYKEDNTENKLEFGIHDNMFIKKIDSESRIGKNGAVLKVLFFVTIGHVSAEGKLDAEHEFIVFPVRHENKFMEPIKQGMNEMGKWMSVLECFYERSEVDGVIDPWSVLGFTNLSEAGEAMKKKSVCDAFNNTLLEQIKNAFAGIINNTSALFRAKITYSSTGEFLEIPKGLWVESMKVPMEETSLIISDYDKKVKAESQKPTVKDGPGNAPTPVAGKPTTPNLANAGVGTPVGTPVGTAAPAPAAAAPVAPVAPVSSKEVPGNAAAIGAMHPLGAIPG
jgi:hypothetical protein